jgi:hypothetical protein
MLNVGHNGLEFPAALPNVSDDQLQIIVQKLNPCETPEASCSHPNNPIAPDSCHK